MTHGNGSRRKFLWSSVTGLGSAWLAAKWPAVLSAQQGAKFEFFTPEQATEIDAICAQIIPTDSAPGAREAHCVNFIDHFLVTYGKAQQVVYSQGLQAFQAEVARIVPGATRFSALTSAQQIEVLTAIEKAGGGAAGGGAGRGRGAAPAEAGGAAGGTSASAFFNQVRTDTIMGMFADPKHGGNFNQVGWKLIGFDMSLVQKPPLGYYDAIPS